VLFTIHETSSGAVRRYNKNHPLQQTLNSVQEAGTQVLYLMATVTFDTHKFVKTLEGAGISEPQAEAISTAVRESHEATDVATKGDIAELRKDMDARFEKTESTFRQELADTRFELLKWMIGLAVAQAGLLITILKFLS